VLALICPPCYSEETTPSALFLTVYPDGFVFVDYTVLVDPTSPAQNITVFGQVLEDLLVADKDGLPLDYSINGNYTINVYSLGTDQIKFTYMTQDLTSKDGRYWTLAIDSPVDAHIILPVEATIISLNQVPELIETSNNRIELLMNASLIEVTYVIGVVGTQEHAQIVLTEAQTVIESIKNLNIKIGDAEAKFQEAQTAFGIGNFVEAETLGSEAKNLAIQINQTAAQAQTKIEEAEDSVTDAQNEERSSGLTDAQSLLDQAKTAYNSGNYSEAINLATQAIGKAEAAQAFLTQEAGSLPIYLIVGAVIVVAAVAVLVFFFVRSRRKTEVREVEKKTRKIDVERIFLVHKDLLPEEKQAVVFLAENNGEAFESDLYEHVKLPRTTTWRLVKRLDRMGIIKRTKFRRQNLICVKNKYTVKD